jgi:DNA-binding CsgD family transcriptional regulator
VETTAQLFGRDRDLDAVISTVDAAANGPASLLLQGEAGIGKTALLTAAATRARQLGHRVVERVEDLGDPRDPGELLRAFERLSRDAPALIVIDDALGAARLDAAAGFARLEASAGFAHLAAAALVAASTERVALLLATREGELPGIPRHDLAPLTDDAAADLLAALPAPPGPGRRREIVRRAAGNPLALLLFSDPHATLPREFADRVRTLPKATRWLLLHAAVAGDAECVNTITRAAGGSPDLRGWAPAEEAGLVVVRDGFVRFRHPLVKAACATGRGPGDVVRAHRSLAAATADAYRRAEHLAYATAGPDERVAAALEAGAGPGYLATARALQLAAQRTPDGEVAARRYARAAFAAHRGGDPEWTVELYDRVRARTRDADIVGVAAGGAAFALLHLARPERAFAVASEAVPGAPRLTTVVAAAAAALLSGVPAHREQLPHLLALVRDDRPAPGEDAMIPRQEWDLARATVRAIAGPAASAAVPEPYGTGPANLTRALFTGALAFMLDDSARTAAELRALWEVSSPFGATGSALTAFPHTVLAMIDSGRWSDADRLLGIVTRDAALRGVPLLRGVVPAFREILDALRGDDCFPGGASGLPSGVPRPFAAGSRSAAAGPRSAAVGEHRDPGPAPGSFAETIRLRAAGLTALRAGDYVGAYRHFGAMFDEQGEPRHYFLGPRSLPQLALAAARSGHAAHAREILERRRAAAGPSPTDRMTMLLAHSAALLDATDGAEEHFRDAVADPLRALRWPLEFGEAQLAFGLWLRHRRRLHDARPHLLAARDTFLRLGARAYADQARRSLPAALRPVGEPAPATDVVSGLTAQKQLIARLVADGLTNRQIAERLFLSPRTVGSHLYRIYAELGVGGRHQLRALVAAGTPLALGA